MAQMTFSAQKGAGNLEHNFDIDYRRQHADRVNPDIDNIVLKHEDIEVAYDKVFGEALKEFNDKQKRNDRKIDNYYEHILKSQKQKPFYEIILTTGNMTDGINEQTKVDILKELYEQFEKNYKNLHIFGAIIHLDEKGSPHLHIDYIPYVDRENCKKGLSRSINQDAAYKAMGFKAEKSYINGHDKKPIIFNGFRNDLCRKAEAIYKNYEIDILHVKAGKDHLDVPSFKDSKAYDDLIAEQEQKLQKLNEQVEDRKEQLEKVSKELETKNKALELTNSQLASTDKTLDGYIKDINELLRNLFDENLLKVFTMKRTSFKVKNKEGKDISFIRVPEIAYKRLVGLLEPIKEAMIEAVANVKKEQEKLQETQSMLKQIKEMEYDPYVEASEEDFQDFMQDRGSGSRSNGDDFML